MIPEIECPRSNSAFYHRKVNSDFGMPVLAAIDSKHESLGVGNTEKGEASVSLKRRLAPLKLMSLLRHYPSRQDT
jgi:hypothetical protein